MVPGERSSKHRCRITNTEFNAQIEAESFCIIVDLVRKNYGSTILPITLIRQDLESGKLIVSRIHQPLYDAFPGGHAETKNSAARHTKGGRAIVRNFSTLECCLTYRRGGFGRLL